MYGQLIYFRDFMVDPLVQLIDNDDYKALLQ